MSEDTAFKRERKSVGGRMGRREGGKYPDALESIYMKSVHLI